MASSNSSSTAEDSFEYDLLVIGGGSGGIASAKRAAQLYNAKVGGKQLIIYRMNHSQELFIHSFIIYYLLFGVLSFHVIHFRPSPTQSFLLVP